MKRFDLSADAVPHASVFSVEADGHEAEIIAVTPGIALRIALAEFPSTRPADPCWETVHRVFPCQRCCYPLALVKIGSAKHVFDAVVNKLLSGEYHTVWVVDVVGSDHRCSGGLQ